MRELREFLASSLRFKWLLAEALARLSVVSVIRFLPLPRRSQFLMQSHRTVSRPHRTALCEEIYRAVSVAARFVPGATCLVKAQVDSAMLNQRGYAAEIKIGVSKRSSSLKAHAWVECDGLVVMGDSRNQSVELPKIAPTPRD
jgi:hypothetical protein